MILEIIDARGLRLWLNGEKPAAKGWSVGGGDGPEAGTYTVNDRNDRKDGLSIASRNVTSLEFEMRPSEEGDGYYYLAGVEGVPTAVTITFLECTHSPPVKLLVTEIQACDPEAESERAVKLSNGETVMIDETMLFLRAETAGKEAP